ncbi:hypothetical protein [Cryobacterium sp. TMT1-66-1]|uniref:hypothetical protein n=1 Tax=Cryobacterium sp. TMT1-66-1 TaxID=1259242 RepID=UPI0010699DF5|nr:hypothetical protein [Cryobacterium sp. TMT1-66-1]TFD07002.1 hypothetical protein E3T29_08300 [Cryobacterium sp. TMT1-66-1]
MIVLPPFDSLYFCEIAHVKGEWVVRHGDERDDRVLATRRLGDDLSNANQFVERVLRCLVTDSVAQMDHNPDRALALAEAVAACSKAFSISYLEVASSDLMMRSRQVIGKITDVPGALAVVRDSHVNSSSRAQVGSPISPVSRPEKRVKAPISPIVRHFEPVKPLNNEWFNAEPRRRPSFRREGLGMAMWSFGLGIVGYFLLMTWFSVVLAVVSGSLAVVCLVQRRGGRGFAIAAVVMSSVCIFVALAIMAGARLP